MDKVAAYQYNKGERAYMSFQGSMFLQDIDGNMWPVYSTDNASVQDWHALRAYQDEQRKKGVSINCFQIPRFADRDQVIKDVEYIFGFNQDDPEIRVFSDSLIAKFTNFRWREGYPK